MNNWRKEILSHNLSIRDNIEKSTISDLEKKSLDVVEKAFEKGMISEEILTKARSAVFNK